MDLCLITCNIRFDNPADGPNSWRYRRSLLAETLLRHSPDIIATQEGRELQLKDLETLLPNYALVDQHRHWIKERMYPSFFLKKDKMSLADGHDIWLSETPNIPGSLSFQSTFPRLVTWMKVRLAGHNQDLLVLNTHLDHIRPETRSGQIQVLVNELKRVWDENSLLMLMGDFNEGPEGEVRRLLGQAPVELQDAWKNCNRLEETSHHAFQGEMQNGSRIDWIMVDRRIEVKSCHMDKSHKDRSFPTDHFPVVCTIKL